MRVPHLSTRRSTLKKASKNPPSQSATVDSIPSVTAVAAPAQETIAARAYAIWEAEGRPDQRALEHWLQAERESESVSELADAAKPSASPEL